MNEVHMNTYLGLHGEHSQAKHNHLQVTVNMVMVIIQVQTQRTPSFNVRFYKWTAEN